MCQTLPPGVSAADRVIFFDGVCKFCSFWTRFVHRNDPGGTIKLATLQSEKGTKARECAGLPPDELNTVIYIENGRIYTKSGAVLRIVRRLSWPWPVFWIFLIVPRFIRDCAYNLVARYRYRLFGKEQSCSLPTPDMRARFLEE